MAENKPERTEFLKNCSMADLSAYADHIDVLLQAAEENDVKSVELEGLLKDVAAELNLRVLDLMHKK